MEVQIVDPREERQGWITEPIREFRVELWFPPKSGNMWSCGDYRLIDAQDVQEALAWAESEASQAGATYALYAILDHGGEGRVWLTGINPTSARGNFERRHPADVVSPS
jgi:hypothetical protein